MIRPPTWILGASLLLFVAAHGMAAAAGVPPATRTPIMPSLSPERLISKIHAIDELEMRAGELAEKKGTTAELRRYGRLLARDHRSADRRLLRLADRARVQVVTVPPEPSERAWMSELERAEGEEFDRLFLHGMRAGHLAAITMLEGQRGRITDRPLQGLLERMIPILRQHERLSTVLEGEANAT